MIDDLDTYAAYGNDSAVQSFDTTVSDGQLNVEFLKTATNNPHLSAIEIIAAGGQGPVVSIGAPSPADVQETGDGGTSTSLVFPVTFAGTPENDVTVEYSVSIDGVVTSGLTQALGTADGSITVGVPNDDENNGAETVIVTLTGITAGTATIGASDAAAEPQSAKMTRARNNLFSTA